MSGKKPQRDATEPSASAPAQTPPDRGGSNRLYTVLAFVVAGLAALVWWSLPADRPPGGVDAGADDPSVLSADSGPKSGIDRPPRASAELAVITDKPDDVVRQLASLSEITKRLDVRYCGGACDAVKKFLVEEDAFEIDIMKTEDLILPPKDTLDTVAVGLTPAERETVHDRKTAIVVRTQGSFTPEQLPARAAFAAAAVLAEALNAFVYDEVSRRIETASEVASHTIKAPLGEPAFARKQIVIQLYRQEDGTARLLTLGMQRLGSPDLSLRGANMASAPLLAEVLNAAASQIAHGKSDVPITVTLQDVARVIGKKPSELNTNPEAARPAVFEIGDPERIEGDPDNDMAELVPKGGANRDAWEAVVADLFGTLPSIGVAANDKELAEVTARAQRELPNVIKRFQSGEGELFVKGPFPIPPEARADGGAATELLWISASSCDARLCTGTLSNEPTYATNLAAGKVTSIPRADVVDWLIQQRDGGAAGGASIKILKARATK